MRKRKTVAGLLALSLLIGISGCTPGGGTVKPSETVTEKEKVSETEEAGTGENGKGGAEKNGDGGSEAETGGNTDEKGSESKDGGNTGEKESETGENETEENTGTKPGDEKAYKEKLVIDEPGLEAFEVTATWESQSMMILPYEDGFLIVESKCNDPETSDPAEPFVPAAKVRIHDIASGEITKQTEIPDLEVRTERIDIYDDGSIGFFSGDGSKYLWLDRDLNITGSFDLEERIKTEPLLERPKNNGAIMRTDRKGGYFSNEGSIYYLDMENGSLTDLGIEVEGTDEIYCFELLYENRELVVVAQFDEQTVYYEYDVTVPDQVIYRNRTPFGEVIFEGAGGDDSMGIYTNMDNGEYRVFTETFSGDELTWFDPGDYLAPSKTIAVGNGIIYVEPGSGASFAYVDLKNECRYRVNLVPAFIKEGQPDYFLAMDYGDYEFCVTYKCAENGNFLIYMMDMEQTIEAPKKVDVHHVTRKEGTDEELLHLLELEDPGRYSPQTMMEKYKTPAEYASALSEAYDIQVVIDEEVSEYVEKTTEGRDSVEYEIVPLEPDDTIWPVLTTMDRVLGTYPEGFFSQLRDEFYPNGLTVCLVEDIKGVDDSTTVGKAHGLTIGRDENTVIVYIDSDEAEIEETIYHEFCHVIDDRISRILAHGTWNDYYKVSEHWSTLNPEGFSYDESYDAYNNYTGNEELPALEYTKYAYDAGAIEMDDIYFIDLYATTYELEDHARIMEYACARKTFASLDSEHIQAKLKYLSEYIRYYFDDSTWPETVVWEQALIK